MSGKEMKVRIMAGTIRARLLGRHSNPTFRRVLANMTDSELVDRQAQFHADSLSQAAQPRQEAPCSETTPVVLVQK
jgi:hypothetical protein